jgi:hypothetical protein
MFYLLECYEENPLMPKPKNTNEIDLLNGDIVKEDVIAIAGKNVRVHQYKNIGPKNETEASSWKEFLPNMEREQKEAKEFFEKRDKEFVSHGPISKSIPAPQYDVTEQPDGSFHVVPKRKD